MSLQDLTPADQRDALGHIAAMLARRDLPLAAFDRIGTGRPILAPGDRRNTYLYPLLQPAGRREFCGFGRNGAMAWAEVLYPTQLEDTLAAALAALAAIGTLGRESPGVVAALQYMADHPPAAARDRANAPALLEQACRGYADLVRAQKGGGDRFALEGRQDGARILSARLAEHACSVILPLLGHLLGLLGLLAGTQPERTAALGTALESGISGHLSAIARVASNPRKAAAVDTRMRKLGGFGVLDALCLMHSQFVLICVSIAKSLPNDSEECRILAATAVRETAAGSEYRCAEAFYAASPARNGASLVRVMLGRRRARAEALHRAMQLGRVPDHAAREYMR